MAHINSALATSGPVDQDLLVDLSRKALKPWLQNTRPPSLDEITFIWHRLTSSAGNHEGNDKYLTTVCNALSVFLTTLSESEDNSLKSFAFSKQQWLGAFAIAQKAFDKGKTKPALQVLETLCLLLDQHPNSQMAADILRQHTKSLLKTILLGGFSHNIKIACIAVSCFMRKSTVAPQIFRIMVEVISEVGPLWHKHLKDHNLSLEDFAGAQLCEQTTVLALLMPIRSLETRSAALKLLKLVCTRSTDTSETKLLLSRAAAATQLYIDRNADLLEDFADNVFPVLLDSPERWQAFVRFFRFRNDQGDAKLLPYLSLLRVGRLKNFVCEEDLAPLLVPLNAANLDHPAQQPKYDPFVSLLRCTSAAVRTHTYNLLVTSHSSHAHVSTKTLHRIHTAWRHLHDDNDAHERGELLRVTSRLLRRIDQDLLVSDKQAPTSYAPDTGPDLSDSYATFLKDTINFLTRELLPGLPYSRHIQALQTLQLFLSLSSSRLCSTQALCKPLLALTLDPYEDVRVTCIEVCKLLFRRPECIDQRPLLYRLAKDVEALSVTTCRHDHADAAGRLSCLAQHIANPGFQSMSSIAQLRAELRLATVLKPGSTFPLHSLLLGATYHLSNNASMPNKYSLSADNDILRVCRKVWELVQSGLCVDSPETASSESAVSSAGPKDLLAYTWRALRDSSLLLQAMLRTYDVEYSLLSATGTLCMEQLTMLRHRGAFSTVAQTFTVCCELARSSSDTKSAQLIEDWYLIATREIRKQASKLTRRSAGLPALINSLLSPNDPTFFDLVFRDLRLQGSQPVALGDVDEQHVELPQVHALNCIKDVIHNSRFRTINERYISDLLELGATGISSDVWAIRNSSLMLLKACMVRLETSGSVKYSIESVAETRPADDGPLKITINLLNKSNEAKDGITNRKRNTERASSSPVARTPRSENIFAALDLVKYVGFWKQSTYLHDLINDQLKSKVWAIRDHAAVVLVEQAQLDANLLDPFSLCPLPPECSANELHGHLLFYRYYLEAQRERGIDEEIDQSLDWLSDHLHTLAARITTCSSPFTQAALLDIANDSLFFILTTGRTLSDLESSLRELHRLCGRSTNPYCQERLFLGRALIYLLGGCELTDHKFVRIGHDALEVLSQDMLSYPDGARYVLEQLREARPGDSPGQWRFVDMTCRLIMDANSNDIRALALTVLAEFLETIEQMAEYFCGEYMKDIAIAMREALPVNCFDDRELWNASLRISAFLFTAELSDFVRDSKIITDVLVTRATQLLDQMHLAMLDVSEFPTRLSATIALRTCVSDFVLLRTKNNYRYTRLTMEALSTLYDQLNDDDEQIRRVATQSAENALHCWYGWPGRPKPSLCPLALREAIVELILLTVDEETDKISETKKFVALLAIKRIVGSGRCEAGWFEAPIEDCLTETVETQLQQIYSSLSDLFTEEKQNLYIDDQEDIVTWCRVLKYCGSQLDDEVNCLVTWVVEGLDQIDITLNAREVRERIPLGPTYNGEILTLFVRVIRLAAVLAEVLHTRKTQSQEQLLTRKLEALEKICVKYEVHEEIVQAFTAGKEVPRKENGDFGWTISWSRLSL